MSRRHSQKGDEDTFVCRQCRLEHCDQCLDKLRLLYAKDRLCRCRRTLHLEKIMGEPRLNQIEDPETGMIYAPGLTVNRDGKVTFLD